MIVLLEVDKCLECRALLYNSSIYLTYLYIPPICSQKIRTHSLL